MSLEAVVEFDGSPYTIVARYYGEGEWVCTLGGQVVIGPTHSTPERAIAYGKREIGKYAGIRSGGGA